MGWAPPQEQPQGPRCPGLGLTGGLALQSMDSSDLSDGAVTLQEHLELKKALATSEAKVQQLMKVNSSLSEELRKLQKEVSRGGAGMRGAPPCL